MRKSSHVRSLRRTHKKETSVPKEVLALLARVGSATVCDASSRPAILSQEIMPLFQFEGLAGRAITALTHGGSILVLQAAILSAKRGDVLVLKPDRTESSIFGGILATAAHRRGIAGVIVDGYIRDVDEIMRLKLPVFARGTCPFATHKRIAGELNVTVTCGGIRVHPRDIIVADSDGIVVAAPSDIPDLIRAVRKIENSERIRLSAILGHKREKRKLNLRQYR
jgi:4-hydroxy-4-methyl-2-oxoglutarate aldolase